MATLKPHSTNYVSRVYRLYGLTYNLYRFACILQKVFVRICQKVSSFVFLHEVPLDIFSVKSRIQERGRKNPLECPLLMQVLNSC